MKDQPIQSRIDYYRQEIDRLTPPKNRHEQMMLDVYQILLGKLLSNPDTRHEEP